MLKVEKFSLVFCYFAIICYLLINSIIYFININFGAFVLFYFPLSGNVLIWEVGTKIRRNLRALCGDGLTAGAIQAQRKQALQKHFTVQRRKAISDKSYQNCLKWSQQLSEVFDKSRETATRHPGRVCRSSRLPAKMVSSYVITSSIGGDGMLDTLAIKRILLISGVVTTLRRMQVHTPAEVIAASDSL